MSNPEIRFCINSTPDASLPDIINWWRACDDAGIHAYGVSDSPIRGPELYATTTLCALNTSRMGIMTCVTKSNHQAPLGCGIGTAYPGRAGSGLDILWG